MLQSRLFPHRASLLNIHQHSTVTVFTNDTSVNVTSIIYRVAGILA